MSFSRNVIWYKLILFQLQTWETHYGELPETAENDWRTEQEEAADTYTGHYWEVDPLLTSNNITYTGHYWEVLLTSSNITYTGHYWEVLLTSNNITYTGHYWEVDPLLTSNNITYTGHYWEVLLASSNIIHNNIVRQPRWLSGLMRSRVHSLWLLVDHCVLRNWDRILVRAVKGLISRAGMVSICPLLWQRDVKLQQTNNNIVHYCPSHVWTLEDYMNPCF